ncbi:MAG: hypothetical protein ACC667_10310 [Longimicrobiales bacterium]
MTPITDNSGQMPTHAEVLWTTPVGRAFSWLLLFSVFATVSLIKYGGVRDLSYANGPAWLAAIWGWLPSYLAALALPYMWPARRRRYLGRVGPVDFLPEVAAGSGTILVLEILGVPGWIGSFEWSDLIAGVAGAVTAFLLYRALVRPSFTMNGQE